MKNINEFVESELAHGRVTFDKASLSTIQLSSEALKSSLTRLAKKGKIASPKRGFYLILRPEDKAFGAPDPARWIDQLMRHLQLDYRISLLRAAAYHGASHQAAMVFQVIVPKQMHGIQIGRQKIEFLYQSPPIFEKTNRAQWLQKLKTDSGFAQVAGLELTLLDCCRYFHQIGGINAAAQVAHDIGGEVVPSNLKEAALAYENSTARRLGYLLEYFGHTRQANALKDFVSEAKSYKSLDPSLKSIAPELGLVEQRDPNWKLILNSTLEIDR